MLRVKRAAARGVSRFTSMASGAPCATNDGMTQTQTLSAKSWGTTSEQALPQALPMALPLAPFGTTAWTVVPMLHCRTVREIPMTAARPSRDGNVVARRAAAPRPGRPDAACMVLTAPPLARTHPGAYPPVQTKATMPASSVALPHHRPRHRHPRQSHSTAEGHASAQSSAA